MRVKVKSQKLNVFLVWAFILFIFYFSCNSGDKMPHFNTQTIDGKSISDESLKGKIVVINIWATWCGPCVKEIPELNELADAYAHDTNIVFIAMTDDKSDLVKRFIEKKQFHYLHICETRNFLKKFSKTLIFSYPQSLVYDKSSVLVYKEADSVHDIKSKLQEKIELLKTI